MHSLTPGPTSGRKPVRSLSAVLAVLLPALGTLLAGSSCAVATTYVGSSTCGGCHAQQLELWRGSDHDRAIEALGADTVLGDFNDASFTDGGVTTRFFRKDDKYFVHTEGEDGEPRDFEVKYTFGYDPLQQYLVDVGDGRLQALTVAWDARPRASGGQRWFHLQAGEGVDHEDPLHWAASFYNWNSRCAACHSTDLRKNFDLATRSYRTEWAEIDVACEACHGPGGAHVAWAGEKPETRAADALYTVDLTTARREIETCAPCHSRRHVIHQPAPPGTPFLDAYVPELLLDQLYFADGQIDDEVYVYGSFVQSKMYAAGVRCSDCHDPHSLHLRSNGNAVCVQCHNPGGNARFPTIEKRSYDDVAHHHHAAGSAGAQCVACHMPARTYMVLDDRRDHSLRIPRPDLTVAYGVPNACNGCHEDKSATWAAESVEGWFGPERPPHWTAAIAAGREGKADATALLARLAGDTGQPAIVRATAVHLLDRFGQSGAAAALKLLGDSEPLVRATAANALESLPAPARRVGLPLLSDPVRAVRIEAARPLAALLAGELDAGERRAIETALAEYREAQQINLDSPEAHLNLGLMHGTLGETDSARREYETAVAIGPYFIPAYVNLADLHRSAGREADAERALRQALAVQPDSADALHSLGLSLVRQRKTAEAVAALQRAAELAPDNARYAYTYGVALHSTGKPDEAIRVLETAQERHPADVDIISALLSFHRDRGDTAAALVYAHRLAAQLPGDPNVANLVKVLEAQAKGTADERR